MFSINHTVKMLEVANEAGIRSLAQLRIFLLHAEAANASIVDVTGFDHTDLEYKQHYTQVRAMSQGVDSRGTVRPDLLKFSDVYEIKVDRQVLLTEKGKALFRKIKAIHKK